MEQRRQTDANPDNNCERYNRAKLVHNAREHKVPIARFDAQHHGVSHEEGMAMDDQMFSGFAKTLELSEHARVLITTNLSVDHGLMNGTQGVVKQFIYLAGSEGPNATENSQRMPISIVVGCPKYDGPAFFTMTLNVAPGCRFNHARAAANTTQMKSPHNSHWSSAGLSLLGKRKA